MHARSLHVIHCNVHKLAWSSSCDYIPPHACSHVNAHCRASQIILANEANIAAVVRATFLASRFKWIAIPAFIPLYSAYIQHVCNAHAYSQHAMPRGAHSIYYITLYIYIIDWFACQSKRTAQHTWRRRRRHICRLREHGNGASGQHQQQQHRFKRRKPSAHRD